MDANHLILMHNVSLLKKHKNFFDIFIYEYYNNKKFQILRIGVQVSVIQVQTTNLSRGNKLKEAVYFTRMFFGPISKRS